MSSIYGTIRSRSSDVVVSIPVTKIALLSLLLWQSWSVVLPTPRIQAFSTLRCCRRRRRYCSSSPPSFGINRRQLIAMSSNTRRSSSRISRNNSDRGGNLIAKRDDINNKNNNNNNHNDDTDACDSSSLLLEEWMTHTDVAYHYISNDEATHIRQALLDWYYVHRRKLPWRGDPPPYDGSTAKTKKDKDASTTKAYNKINHHHHHNNDDDDDALPASVSPKRTAYGIWVSEIMLQQTRVEAVIPYWLRWMKTFPTVHHLASASPEQVNAQWAGLGFYRRARLLHQAAQHLVAASQDLKGKEGEDGGVVDDGDVELPRTVKELQAIPGIGPYTAAAIASMAFDVSVPVVDGNVCRVLARLRGIAHHIKAPILKDKVGWDLAAQIIQAGGGTHAGDVNQAMMELGATYCAPSGTGVDPNDPLKDFYWSTRLGAEYYQHVVLSSSPSSSSSPVASLVDKFIDNPPPTSASSCPLCDHQRMVAILNDMEGSIKDLVDDNGDNNELSAVDRARQCGHAVFPTAPPKQSKREEVLAVAVISMTAADSDQSDSDTYWLLVKRPKTGLLAGQWELPATCVWSSDDDKTKQKPTSPNDGKANGTKRKDRPSSSSSSKKCTQDETLHVKPRVRRIALQKLLEDVAGNIADLSDSIRTANLSSMDKPIEHVFSHVRHTMWIEHASITFTNGPVPSPSKWLMSSTDQEVRWMRESDMKLAGVTSGVKKILKAVQDERKAVKEKENAAVIAAEKKRNFFQPKAKKRK